MSRPAAVSRAVAGLAAALVIGGCGLLPSAPPDWVANRSAMPSCGEETLDRGLAENGAGWDCLMAALERSHDAELIRHLTTLEGDPVRQILRIHADGQIELIVDATRDRFGSGQWERLSCGLTPGQELKCVPLPIP
jgi:nucleotide-binding universal stress UspA family protein